MTEVETAVSYYKKHLERMRNYLKNNPEQNKLRQKKYMDKLKEEQPERYAELMERKKETSKAHYDKIRKTKTPKVEESKEAKETK